MNCVEPAPVAARSNTCQRIVDVIIGALAKALPTAVVAASNGANTAAVFSGIDPATGRGYVYIETIGGGFGGRATKDGTDGVQVHSTNTSNLPVEIIETEYPLRVKRYELVRDSGGAGMYRERVSNSSRCNSGWPQLPFQRAGRTIPAPTLGPVWRRSCHEGSIRSDQ